ncbi:transcription factor LHW isoform X1 [Olea europaea subsp. europaea]|uniref:Transcription factor LHW isoform X1 n=2 Tax=Olea europaea subsp. europaea TaxID=158383 RepID=A0A8S0TYZ3_OLEEU|nr:transcription factor LHW isoform X1 [Olea europaea subsp. europaea]
MGYLFKEVLKTLCGVNQWDYAVLWKIGCQNPKLLIWEECYYSPLSCAGLPGISRIGNPKIGYEGYNASWVLTENHILQPSVQAENKLHVLVNQMMTDQHVNIVGEGLVGRAAFTGNPQWILLDNFTKEPHPGEVLKELYLQFSAGMQTLAVIPVLPHGVVQLGSHFTIVENMRFINDVKTLVLQMSYAAGGLLSDNHTAKILVPETRVSECLGNFTPGDSYLGSNMMKPTPPISDSCIYAGNSTQTSRSVSQTSCSFVRQMSNGAAFQTSNLNQNHVKPHDNHQESELVSTVKFNFNSKNQSVNALTKADVIPSNPEIWLNQQASMNIPRSMLDQQPSCSSSTLNNGNSRWVERQISLVDGTQGHFSNQNVSTGILMSAQRTNSDLISSSNEDSVTIPSAEISGLHEVAGGHVKSILGTNSVSDTTCRPSNGNIDSMHFTSSGLPNTNSSKIEPSFSDSSCYLTTNHLLAHSSGSKHHYIDDKFAKNELKAAEDRLEKKVIHTSSIIHCQHEEHQNFAELNSGFLQDDRQHEFVQEILPLINTKYEDGYVQPQSGDDLFDILGVDFKNELLRSCWDSSLNDQSDPNTNSLTTNNSLSMKTQDAASEIYPVDLGNSESGIFSVTSSDHLLDAVVSRVHSSSLDDNVSCKTTLTYPSSSSAPNASLSTGRMGVSDQLKEKVFGIPKYMVKAETANSCSFRSGCSKVDSGTLSQSSSIYGSQISSWIEKGRELKQSSSVSTGYSKKPDETNKTTRKRLKPGENPRPRPKDRQMIQDRVKELREIVPNGAKCSIDALLERTIKHMLFLQSVTKHADKLKQTGESKVINKDGGLLLRENLEGGATWAYEVGSQSMVCPIKVEDLNQPRQMLVKMLCEEQGLFLEIADMIRGMGLTILKGVMETWNNKIWAHFVVEANRDVTRMDIFVSLVRLLEQTGKSGVAPAKGIDNESTMIQQFHQVASIPVTGRSRSLQ